MFALPDFDNWSDKLDEESRNAKEGRVEVVQKVDDQPFDVRSVVILIGHDHEMTVSQAVDGGVVLIVLETENLFDMLDFDVLDNLVVTGLSYVEKLSSEREYSILVSTDNTQPRHGESLGRVSFRQDESAPLGVSPTGIVGVFELHNSRDSGPLRPVGLLQDLILLEPGPAQDIVDDTGFGD